MERNQKRGKGRKSVKSSLQDNGIHQVVQGTSPIAVRKGYNCRRVHKWAYQYQTTMVDEVYSLTYNIFMLNTLIRSNLFAMGLRMPKHLLKR